MTALEVRLLAALRKVTPYAESRAEDMVECAEQRPASFFARGDRVRARNLAKKAWTAVEEAQRLIRENTVR